MTRDDEPPVDRCDDRHGEGAELRSALTAGDVVVHLQPQMSLLDGRTVGVEALVRWEHPSRGVLAPRDLLPLAAHAGLQHALTEVVLDLALGCAARWWSHRAPLPVSVNLAATDVTDPHLPATVTAALARHGLPPRALTLEVVEETVVRGADAAHAVLTGLRALGVTVSVDDDGHGQGVVLPPRRLPADELQLAPSLVALVATDPRAAAVARHTVALAHSRGLRVVAKGAEDGPTIAALAATGCDAAQGFEITAPMPPAGFVTWLRERPADRRLRSATVPQQAGPYRATVGASSQR